MSDTFELLVVGHDNKAYESEDCEAEKTNDIELDKNEIGTRNDETSKKGTNGRWVEVIHRKVRVMVFNVTFKNISVI